MNLKWLSRRITLFCSLFLIVFSSPAKELFFDMGGVLLKTSKFRAFTRLGMEAMSHANLKDRFFEFINFVDKEKQDVVATFDGVKLPPSFCKWQKGLMTCDELVNFILTEADKHPDFFKNKTEQKLIKKSARLLLPHNNVAVTKTMKDMIRLVKDCKNKKDANGNLVNKVYLTSNCDSESFAAFQEAFPEVFELFEEDKILISGEIKTIKPDKSFYEQALEKFGCNANNCVLIDDQSGNIDGAKKLNINGILHKNSNKTRKMLKQMNVI